MIENILVRHFKHLTPDWAQRIVDKHAGGATVVKADIVSVDTGTTTRGALANPS